jgi:TRAP-type C4-dicarboxylate transport system permease small subunit
LAGVSTTTNAGADTGSDAAAPSRLERGTAVAKRVWPEVALLLAAFLWWPVGFWGVTSWLHLPLTALDGDVALLGATAAAASVSLLVRSPWPRFAIVLVSSGLGWLLSAPAVDTYPDEREVLAILLAVAACAGIALGARGHKGALGAATVLVLLAGLSPATWPHGLPVAVALALPFVVATWQKVAPTLLSVARILVTWLVLSLLAAACKAGWDILHPRMNTGSKRGTLKLVADASWDFLRTQWWDHSEALLRSTAGWFWVALVLAVLFAAARVLISGWKRRSAPARTTRPPG